MTTSNFLYRWYSEVTAVPSATLENRSRMLRVIDKAFVLDFALKRLFKNLYSDFVLLNCLHILGS